MNPIISISKLIFALVLALGLLVASGLQAQTFNVIHSFAGSDGSGPLAGLAIDSKGNIYGTTNSGGAHGAGVVFRANGSGQERVLYSFGSITNDGANPESSLIFDAAGNLYGTTFSGGTSGDGTVFRLTPKGVETVLYSFAGGADGANPEARLAMDKFGNLYGTTTAGGTSGNGTVFEISKAGQHSVLYSFGGGNDGTVPVAGVTLDAKGNLYGTTSTGGQYGYGTVFELKRLQSGWAERILHNFQMLTDGGTPYAGLIFDPSGNLFGAATDGGDGSGGGGTIFELSPSGNSWTFKVLYGLAGWGISGAFRDILFDAASGVLYGTSHCDGTYNDGTVWELTPSGGTWNYTELYTFTGHDDGLYIFSNLVSDKGGNLYGTAREGGANGVGVIFQVLP
ncbi:MAG: choice-of-anchor tandem repeat GloVer-containing protein [Candidatus Sulfotelmatobacter sp.]